MTSHPAELDPRVKAANMQAAARYLAEAAAALEVIEADLKDLDQDPPSAARVARRFALQFKRSAAQRTERCALREARRAGLLDLTEYPADVDGLPYRVFIDGPSVSLFSD